MTVSQPDKVFSFLDTLTVVLAASQQIQCTVWMNRVIDCRLVVDEVIQQWNQCAALFFVPSMPLWHLEKGRQSRKNRRKSEDVPLGWSGSGLSSSDCSGSSAILGLHHEDYCNTVQMGPCCNRLGRVDWTNWRGGGGVAKVRWWMASLTLRTSHQSWPCTLTPQSSRAKSNVYS